MRDYGAICEGGGRRGKDTGRVTRVTGPTLNLFPSHPDKGRNRFPDPFWGRVRPPGLVCLCLRI